MGTVKGRFEVARVEVRGKSWSVVQEGKELFAERTALSGGGGKKDDHGQNGRERDNN